MGGGGSRWTVRPSGRSLKRRLGGKKVAPEVEAGPEEAPEEEGDARAEEEEGEREGTTGISLERRFGGGALAASSGRFSARRGVIVASSAIDSAPSISATACAWATAASTAVAKVPKETGLPSVVRPSARNRPVLLVSRTPL